MVQISQRDLCRICNNPMTEVDYDRVVNSTENCKCGHIERDIGELTSQPNISVVGQDSLLSSGTICV